MAQPIIEEIDKNVNREAADQVSSYTSDGQTYTAQQREKAVNEAIGDIYTKKLEGLGIEQFSRIYPEFVKEKTITVTPNGNSKLYIKDSDVRLIFNILLNISTPASITNGVAHYLKAEVIRQALYDSDSEFAPTTDNPKFSETERYFSLELGGSVVVTAGTIKPLCLLQPIYVAYNASGTDTIIPRLWIKEVSVLAAQLIKSKTQRR